MNPIEANLNAPLLKKVADNEEVVSKLHPKAYSNVLSAARKEDGY